MLLVEYKRFKLTPCPYQFQDSGEWIVRVTIALQDDGRGEIRRKPFCSSKIFSRKTDADHHAILFGKEVIDRRHPNLSVDGLY